MTSEPPLIVHIIYRLGIGGLENGLVNLINSIPTDRYRHVVVCLAGYTDFASRIRRDDVRVYDLEKSPGKGFGYHLRLFKLLRRLRPEIVHTRNLGTLECQFVAAAAGVSCRIHGEHGWDVGDLHGQLRKHILLRRLSRIVVQQYVVMSKHMQIWLRNVIGIPAERIRQIYNGINSEKFFPNTTVEASVGVAETDSAHSFVIGTVGRLDPIKDQVTLLRAFEQLVNRLPKTRRILRLVIVGAGEMRHELVCFARDRGIESQVSFAGASDDVPSSLRSFDLFVLPSLNEGISNTILEAMATGLPVVASEAGGNPELVIREATGSLFPPGDSDALADCIEYYVRNPTVCLVHGSAGRTRAVKHFSMQAMIDSYLDLYDQIVSSR